MYQGHSKFTTQVWEYKLRPYCCTCEALEYFLFFCKVLHICKYINYILNNRFQGYMPLWTYTGCFQGLRWFFNCVTKKILCFQYYLNFNSIGRLSNSNLPNYIMIKHCFEWFSFISSRIIKSYKEINLIGKGRNRL